MLFPLQVMEGDEQAKAWVALDESTPSPLPFQRRVIYESPEDDPLLVYGFQINLLSYRMVVESCRIINGSISSTQNNICVSLASPLYTKVEEGCRSLSHAYCRKKRKEE